MGWHQGLSPKPMYGDDKKVLYHVMEEILFRALKKNISGQFAKNKTARQWAQKADGLDVQPKSCGRQAIFLIALDLSNGVVLL